MILFLVRAKLPTLRSWQKPLQVTGAALGLAAKQPICLCCEHKAPFAQCLLPQLTREYALLDHDFDSSSWLTRVNVKVAVGHMNGGSSELSGASR